jgi:hypothetical protein
MIGKQRNIHPSGDLDDEYWEGDPMINVDLAHVYQRKSDVELIVIATDDVTNYTPDAMETASAVLLSRHPGMWTVEAVRDDLLQQLTDLANKCSICRCPEVVSSIGFQLCTMEALEEDSSVAGMALLFVLGAGFVRTKQSSVLLELKLCVNCLKERTVKTWKGTRIQITEDDCVSHPFYEFYKAQGYCDVRM